ncbi:MAG: guanylate kinase [Bacteroidales bacterium]|nr:guanylate kinase [Bacteroidales bacterium]MBD5215937.1 guanylate kinase [Bacteroidales bacterium]MBD5218744.1 guanylate kinase [Bacteroidales bacterium]
MNKGKIIVIAAPSGCGKSTIINALLEGGDLNLGFAVSATTRAPRQGEKDGVNYYFMTEEAFRDAIVDGEFLEYEEVYPGRFYGTLRSEIDRIIGEGRNIILDLDVNGALRVKQEYGPQALAVFIAPPSIDELRHRLELRGTESPEVIDTRVDRAEYEISRAPEFDRQIVNDDLATAIRQTRNLIDAFASLQ